MLPHFVFFNFGYLFLEKYEIGFYDHVKIAKKKFKENIDFYKVLYSIIWSKNSSAQNKVFIICFFLVCLKAVLEKLDLFLDKEITNSFSNVSDSSNFVVPWGFLILRSMMEIIEQSLSVVKRKQFTKVEKKLSDRVQVEAFSKIHEMSTRWNIEKGIGEINTIVERGSCLVWSIIATCLDGIFPTVVSVIFSFYYVSTRYSLIMGIIILAFSTINPVAMHMFRKWSKAMRDKKIEAEEETLGRSMDSLSNFQTVKNFTGEDDERRRFRKLKEEQTNSGIELEDWSDLFYYFLSSLSTVFSLGVTLYGANQLSQNQISYGDYVLLSRLFFNLYYSLWDLYYDVVYGILNNCEVLNKTVSLLNETPEITDKINATDINLKNGRIEFKNVTFSYATNKDSVKNNASVNDSVEKNMSALDDDDNKNNTNDDETKKDSPPVEVINKDSAITDVSFAVEAGHCLALVGPSGSGKSTIAKLLMRMYNVDEGEIFIDHQAISEVTLKSLRSSIGVVPQEVEMFNDKVGDNIRYGRPEASDDEVQEAALKAEIHEKIITMDEKYQTKVGNRGLKLSGGERQRVGIGRIFLKNPKIVILDEATSALDTITERKIQSSLEKTYKGKTSVIIAHRLSTICNADQIIVLDKGKIVEKGSHKELIKLRGMYQQLWNQQTENKLQQEKKQSEIDSIFV